MQICFPVIILLLLATQAHTSDNPDFLISFWCGPPPAETTQERYAEIKEAGFNVVTPSFGWKDVALNKKILDLCQANGMKAIVSDARVMSKKPDDPDFEKNLDAVLADYSSHPALYGYHLKDEPNSADFPYLAAVSRYLMKKDPKHVPYINLLPTYANEGQLGNKTYEEHVSQFIRKVKPALLSYDHYSQMTNYDGMEYFRNLEIIRRQSQTHQVPFINVVLMVPHGPYRNPSMADLRWQIYTTLAYGARGISYYTYWTPGKSQLGYYNAVIDRDGKRTEHYDQIRFLNARTIQLAKTLVKLNSKAVYHTAPIPPEAKPLPENWLVRKIGNGKLVIGYFEDGHGFKYLMFVNRDMKDPVITDIELAPEAIPLRDVLTNQFMPLNRDGKSIRLALDPGDGKLFIVDRWNDIPLYNLPFEHQRNLTPGHPQHQALPGW